MSEIKREIDDWSIRQAIELDSVPHRKDGDVLPQIYASQKQPIRIVSAMTKLHVQ